MADLKGLSASVMVELWALIADRLTACCSGKQMADNLDDLTAQKMVDE